MRKFMLGLALCSVSMGVYAQSNSLGINAGAGHSWIKNYGNTQFKTHGNFGISYVHSTKSRFGFGADVKYSLEGGEGELPNNVRHETSLHYIRIPLKAMFFFGDYGQRVRPKVQIGPSLGILVHTDDRYEDTRTGATTRPGEVDDYFNNFDIGIQGGAGIHYRLVRNTWFTADLNYYNGFRDIRQANSGGTPRHANSNVSANIGVLWGIGK